MQDSVPVDLVTGATGLVGNNLYDPAKAIRELEMPQTPIETAIAQAVTWLRSQKLLGV